MQDTFHLFAGVDTGVVGRIAVFASSLGTTEVHAAGKLADAYEIGSGDEVGTERRFVDQRRKSHHGADVSVQSQLLAHTKQTLLGAHLGFGIVVEFGMADCAKKHRVGLHAQSVRFRRIGIAHGIDSTRAHHGLFVR